MTHDEFHRSVLTFLDQFIQRGAAADILDVAHRLRTDAQLRQSLTDRLPNDDPTDRQAFDALRSFLEALWEQRPEPQPSGPPDLVLLIFWMSWESSNQTGHFEAAGSLAMTSDPAQWDDWLDSVHRVILQT